MIDPGEKNAGAGRFAPLRGVIKTPLQADIVAYWQDNPEGALDAIEMAGKMKREDIKVVSGALEELEEAGVLSGEIKGVDQTRAYRFRPNAEIKQALDRIFSGAGIPDSWKEFRGGLEQQFRRAEAKRKIIVFGAGILIALGLAAGIYFAVQRIGDPGAEPVRADLSEFTGVHETRYRAGQIKSRIDYSDGRREGSFEAWFDNGQKMAEGSYRGDRPDGRWIFWDAEGNPLTMVIYEDGRAVSY